VSFRRPLRVVIAGGGTGGHVFPAIAVAQALEKNDSRHQVLFVGSHQGLEAKLVPEYGYELKLLPVGKLRGTSLLGRLRTLSTLPLAVSSALRTLLSFRPHVVLGVGGYASGPIALAAVLLRKPVVLLEQNAIAGATNRGVSLLASRVVTSFEDTVGFAAKKTVALGNPLRMELLEALSQRKSATGGGRCLLVLGGSQGARRLNELMMAVAPALAAALPELHVIHQTGQADQTRVQEAYRNASLSSDVHAFISDMAAVYQRADFAFCRAGATTCAELAVAGIPAFFVPYPYAASDHQMENARRLCDAGGAVVMRQNELDETILQTTLVELLQDELGLARMSEQIRRQGRPRAADDVVSLLQQLCG
jgi:UDP-N-acetylglucosamine--N-acetylmuramyl-(pentapeptide) pyrophosphoryl-undecaprenol N-acetylglucosamine transferase